MLLCKTIFISFPIDRLILFTHLSNNLGDETTKNLKNMTKNIYNFISSVDKYILYKLIYDENSLKSRKREEKIFYLYILINYIYLKTLALLIFIFFYKMR